MLVGKVSPNVKFVVVTEPVAEDLQSKDCEEIG